MKICSKCKTENLDSKTICISCGSTLPEKSEKPITSSYRGFDKKGALALVFGVLSLFVVMLGIVSAALSPAFMPVILLSLLILALGIGGYFICDDAYDSEVGYAGKMISKISLIIWGITFALKVIALVSNN